MRVRAGASFSPTGDQYARDTPFEYLEAMIETARSYGRY